MAWSQWMVFRISFFHAQEWNSYLTASGVENIPRVVLHCQCRRLPHITLHMRACVKHGSWGLCGTPWMYSWNTMWRKQNWITAPRPNYESRKTWRFDNWVISPTKPKYFIPGSFVYLYSVKHLFSRDNDFACATNTWPPLHFHKPENIYFNNQKPLLFQKM